VIAVVAGAVLRDGRVLAARRRRPVELAGGWEFPGGKVEADEDPRAALARELHEELGLAAAVGAELGRADDGRIDLVLFAVSAGTEPRAGADHDELRWLGPTDLDAVGWLPIDRALLAAVRARLTGPS
jgi:8-oxo-dGTP diphosphatase